MTEAIAVLFDRLHCGLVRRRHATGLGQACSRGSSAPDRDGEYGRRIGGTVIVLTNSLDRIVACSFGDTDTISHCILSPDRDGEGYGILFDLSPLQVDRND